MESKNLPQIITEIPGPESLALAQRLDAVECSGITYTDPEFPVFWDRAEGANIWDVDGNRFIDACAAFAVCGVGHRHPKVVAAIQAQSEKLLHAMGDVHPGANKVDLMERLAAVTPGELSHTILGSSGSDAVEAARKVCAVHTGKSKVLAFHGAYHGLTYGALEATARRDFREPFAGQLRGAVVHTPYPNPYRPVYQGDLLDETLKNIRRILDAPTGTGEEIGGILVEPVQGRAGNIFPPDGFLTGLREICDERGLLLIFDEIYTGFGRTGVPFAANHEGVVPDLMCLGKGMTGGMPISACIGKKSVMDSFGPSTGEALHTQTFLGHPLGCASALAAIEILFDDGLIQRAQALGALLGEWLKALQSRFPMIGEVRGRGLMWAIEFVEDRESKRPATGFAAKLMKEALKEGLILLPCGVHGSILALSPPMVISEAQLRAIVDIISRLLSRHGH